MNCSCRGGLQHLTVEFSYNRPHCLLSPSLHTQICSKANSKPWEAPVFLKSTTFIDQSPLKWSSYKTERPNFLRREEFRRPSISWGLFITLLLSITNSCYDRLMRIHLWPGALRLGGGGSESPPLLPPEDEALDEQYPSQRVSGPRGTCSDWSRRCKRRQASCPFLSYLSALPGDPSFLNPVCALRTHPTRLAFSEEFKAFLRPRISC